MADGVAGDVDPNQLLGERIAGRFVVERLIGTGELSSAFRAYDDRLHRRVTVKLFHPRHRDDVQVVESQLAAARAVARLSHEHVAMVIDRGEHDGMPLVVLEYVRGENLQERIERFAPLAVGEVVTYALQVARALAYAHGHGVFHGNLRPGNVLLTEEREVKLVDFGGGSYVAQLVGDPFAAPELSEVDADAPAEPSDDVYALGALVFVALTEQAPVPGLDPSELQLLRPDVSPRLAAIVARALATDPGDRYLSMRELAAELSVVREAVVPPSNDLPRALDRGQATRAFSIDDEDGDEDTSEATGVIATSAAPATPRPLRRKPREPRSARTPREVRARILAWSMVLAPLAALVIFGIMIAGERGSDQVNTGQRSGTGPAREIPIVGVVTFDPDGDGEEHPADAANVFDKDPATTWETEGYDQTNFSEIKPGVGIALQLEKPVEVRELKLATTLPGWTVEVYVADTPERELAGWTKASEPAEAADGATIEVDTDGEAASYVLLWVTQLAIDTEDTNRARARLGEVTVFGRSGGS